MKYRIQLLSVLTLLLLDGCAGFPIPSFGAETETPFAPTPTLIPVTTVTPAPTSTPSPTVTVTPTPTLFLTPTETPENFVLAESGYDIANVRLSYPREDILVIDFEYRLDESIESKSAFILMELPRRCQDTQSSAFSQVEGLVGEGQITFKTTLQGECLAESFELVVWPLFENGGYSGSTDPAYRETIRQPYYLVRNFPTLNKDVLTVRSFDYRGTGEWSGIFSFEYSIAETIPIPPEEHYFSITGVGNEDCDFGSQGPVLTEHAGTYEIPIDLSRHVYDFRKQGCLDGFTSHSYATIRLYLIDQLAGSTVVFQSLNFPIKIWKAP